MGDVSGTGFVVVFLIIMFCYVLGIRTYRWPTYDLYDLFGVSARLGLCYLVLVDVT